MRRSILIAGVLWGCDVPGPGTPAVGPGADTDLPPAPVCASPTTPHGLRRLTRFQYDRVVSDLLGEDLAVAAAFPLEAGSWEGTTDAQAISPNLVDGWWKAADALSARPFATDFTRIELEDEGFADGSVTAISGDPGLWWNVPVLADTVLLPVRLDVAAPGRYRVTVRAVRTVGFDKTDVGPQLAWRVGSTLTPMPQVTGVFDAPSVVSVDLDLPGATDATLVVSPASGSPGQNFEVLALDRVDVEGPVTGGWVGESQAQRKWIDCTPDASDLDGCVSQILTRFADTAWRRAPADEEIASLTDLVRLALDDGEDVTVGMQLAMRAVLFSPSFLFRYEDVAAMSPGDVRAATGDELATRLAFLLWGSLPDDTLRACAAEGRLSPDPASTDACGLSAQVDRMLASPRSDAIERDFGRQWLGVDAAASFVRDPVRYPSMDAALARASAEGAYGMLAEARRSALDVRDLIDASWEWSDARLAAVYGVPPPSGGAGRVGVTGDRLGLLGSAFVLMATSHADRPSPVLRGRWVLDRLLCAPTGDPPAGIPALPAGATSGDVRTMLEAHRADPACSFCHERIDPIGLAVEGFDAMGVARTAYEDGTPVDTRTTLEGGVDIEGLADLAHALRADPRLTRCLVRQAATWSWERIPTSADEVALADVEAAALADGFTLDALIRALALSDETLCVSTSGGAQ